MIVGQFLAFDLGAESGRAILGELREGRLSLREIRRFPNGALNFRGHSHWNVFRLYEEMKESLRACAGEMREDLKGIGIDTWGVDFALLAGDGSILGLPYTYRDGRTQGAMEHFFTRLAPERVYRLTGIQFLPINTLFQLFAMVRDNSPLLEVASDLLFIPDLFNYLFTGEKRTEFTFATTSQLYNPWKSDWDDDIFAALGISPAIMQTVVPPGSLIGEISPAICQETGLPGPVPVIAPATHDTGSAVAAVPAAADGWAYISSGTWSLMGIEIPEPICNESAREFNFTNEGGVEGTFRFLKNIMGLWLVQGCRKAWKEARAYSYEELTQMAAASPPFVALIDPDRDAFLNPPDMPAAIRQFCHESGQSVPESPGGVVRCILESLALQYRSVLEQLREMISWPIHTIHVVGGGAQNRLLCQFTADATGLPVVAGPAEATAIGNILVQAIAMGYIGSLAEAREVIRHSFELVRYEPQDGGEWDIAYERFCSL